MTLLNTDGWDHIVSSGRNFKIMLESGRKRFRLINRRNKFGLPPIPFCQVKLRQVKADQIINYSVNILSKHFGYAFLGMIRIRINGSRSIGSCCIKSTIESLSRMDLSVPLTHWDASDLGSLILIRIIPKESTPVVLIPSTSQ